MPLEWVIIAVALLAVVLVLSRGSDRAYRKYLAELRAKANEQFRQLAVPAPDGRMSFSGRTARIVDEHETVSGPENLITTYVLTRLARNESGEYFLFKSSSAQPYFKHVSHEAARAILKERYLPPESTTLPGSAIASRASDARPRDDA